MADETYLLVYAYVDGMIDRRTPYRQAHLDRITAEREAGRVILAGALGNPPTGGAIAFRGVAREHVEQFAAGDPYVEAGLVTSRRIELWNAT
jgi:uncharacterized protein YciI